MTPCGWVGGRMDRNFQQLWCKLGMVEGTTGAHTTTTATHARYHRYAPLLVLLLRLLLLPLWKRGDCGYGVWCGVVWVGDSCFSCGARPPAAALQFWSGGGTRPTHRHKTKPKSPQAPRPSPKLLVLLLWGVGEGARPSLWWLGACGCTKSSRRRSWSCKVTKEQEEASSRAAAMPFFLYMTHYHACPVR